MKRQLSMFDGTHGMLCTSEQQALEALKAARKAHRGQQAAKLIHQAIVHAKLKYETRKGLTPKASKTSIRAA